MFDSVTPRSIWESIVSNLDTGLIDNEGSFVRDVLAPAVLEIYKVYKSMDALEPMFYIDETSGPYIDKMAGIFGLTRKSGTRASCTMTLQGTAGAVIPAGTAFLTVDGLAFTLDADVTLTGGTGSGTATAAVAGAIYNIGAGELVRLQSSVFQLSSWSNTAAAGGTDGETDKALVTRFYSSLATPGSSGNAYHYQAWATEVSGVGGARVIGLWDGPGTVKVILIADDMGAVDAAVLSEAAAYIETQRPVGADVTVVSATETQISVSAAVTLSDGADLSAVTQQLRAALEVYLTALTLSAFPVTYNAELDTVGGLTVSYHMIATLLMECDGVEDFSSLTVNGGTANVTMGSAAVPVLSGVTLT